MAFELPSFYRGVSVIERGRRVVDEPPIFDSRAADVLEQAGTDVADLKAMTPLQAAIDLWGAARGLPFAFEAFVEYCHQVETEAPHLFQHWPDVRQLLEFVRSAPDPVHAEVAVIADRLRKNEPSGFTRALTTFLFPERRDWFWADLIATKNGLLPPTTLLPSVTTADHAAAIAEEIRQLAEWSWDGDPEIELTFLTVAGAEALPFLHAWRDAGHRCPPADNGHVRQCAVHARCDYLIAHLPEADAPSPSPDVATREEVPVPSEEAATAADLSDLPEILAAPPWRDKKRKRTKPVVVEGLTAPDDTEVAWLPGERERWLDRHGAGWVPNGGWESVRNEIADGTAGDLLAAYFVAYGPDDLVRPLLETWTPALRWANDRVRTCVARYEALALPGVLAAGRRPAERAQLLQPFVNPEIAAIMMDGMARLRSVRGHAVAWLRRHPEAAARCLLPTALGKPGKARQTAVAALRMIESQGIDVAAVARKTYGEDVGTAAEEVLADDGLGAYPRTVPQVPLWARAESLPLIRLKDGEKTLPWSAAQAVVEMLMFSKADAPYPGLEIVKEVCDARSLAEFAWSVHASAPSMEQWAFDALGLLGDDGTVARLRLQMASRSHHPGSRNEAEALGVLAKIGGDLALTVLHTFAQKGSPASFKRKAQATFDDVAQAMDLSADQLADRVIPDLGLSRDGTFRVDYGIRHFDVGFDELLRPRVIDEAGKVLKALPKPGKRDAHGLADDAYKQFVQLKSQARTVASDEIKRLKQAMLARRRWEPSDFTTYLVTHPLLQHVVRRLVWGVYDVDGAVLGSFRVAEDLSFADVDDAHYEVPQGALIGVAHPVDLATGPGRWSEVFADYEILQPFDQLGRPLPALTSEERKLKRLDRWPSGYKATRFVGLESRGWQRGPISGGPIWSRLLRPVGDGRYVITDFEPGIEAGAPAQSSYQSITAVWLSATGENPDFARHALPLSELDAVSASEVLRDLEQVAIQ